RDVHHWKVVGVHVIPLNVNVSQVGRRMPSRQTLFVKHFAEDRLVTEVQRWSLPMLRHLAEPLDAAVLVLRVARKAHDSPSSSRSWESSASISSMFGRLVLSASEIAGSESLVIIMTTGNHGNWAADCWPMVSVMVGSTARFLRSLPSRRRA